MIRSGKNGTQTPCLQGEQQSTGHVFCATVSFWKVWWIHEAFDFEYSAFSEHEASMWLMATVLALFLGLLLVQKLIGLLGFPSTLL